MPRIKTVQTNTECLQILVKPDTYDAVIAAATQARKSISSMLRELIEAHYLESNPSSNEQALPKLMSPPSRQQVDA